MSEQNKAILNKANAAVAKGDYEAFISHCTEDTEWIFVGDKTLRGKEAVRKWMADSYMSPPRNSVANLIAEGEYVVVYGDIAVTNEDGTETSSSYCDVWRFQDGKMAELRAYVVEQQD